MGRNVLIVSETHLPVDGRSLRFAAALKKAGYRVCGAGFREREIPVPAAPAFDRLILVKRPRASRLRRLWLPLTLVFGAVLASLAPLSYWLHPHRHALYRKIMQDAARPGSAPDIVIAKHWSAGLLGLSVARKFGVPFVYDANELSFAEHEQNRKWRLLAQPVIRELDRILFSRSDLATTIGRRVADEFVAEYKLAERPIIIRNIPDAAALAPRDPGNSIRFIYIGLAHPVRHLEDIIDSVPGWKPDRSLVLQLTGDPEYISALRKRANTLGLGGRVEFRNPVPDPEIVASLEKADVGLCIFRTFSRQMLYAEPNKFYQYIAGGLPVLASQVPRLAEIIADYQCGWSMPGRGPGEIVAAVNAIGREDIRKAHTGVRAAQADFTWETEARRLTGAIGLIADPASGTDTAE